MHAQSSTLWKQLRSRTQTLNEDRGNILFIILLAVALFAALAYAVTQSTRSGGGDASREQNILLASQITQYGTEIQTAIMRMKISNGCTDEQISFENPIVSGYTNPNAPTDSRCHVFHPNGGNVTFKKPPPNSTISNPTGYAYTNYVFTGIMCVPNVGTGGTECRNNSNLSDQDIVMLMTDLSVDLCKRINDKLGITNPGGSLPQSWGVFVPTADYFKGTFREETTGSYNATETIGRHSGCAQVSGGYTYYFHVLVPR